MRAVAEGQTFWCFVQVEAEESSEHSTSDDKVLAVSPEVEPLGPRLFICCKGVSETLYL